MCSSDLKPTLIVAMETCTGWCRIEIRVFQPLQKTINALSLNLALANRNKPLFQICIFHCAYLLESGRAILSSTATPFVRSAQNNGCLNLAGGRIVDKQPQKLIQANAPRLSGLTWLRWSGCHRLLGSSLYLRRCRLSHRSLCSLLGPNCLIKTLLESLLRMK